MKSAWVRGVWLFAANLDLALFYGIWVRVLRVCGWWVLADRYLYDTELDYELSVASPGAVNSWSWRMCRRVAPKPDVELVFVVTVEESLRRSALKREPFPDSAEILAVRRARYLRYSTTRPGVILIDGNSPSAAVEHVVRAACRLTDAY